MHEDRRSTRHERGYTNRWLKARKTWLARHPLCVYCERRGVITAACVVDHIVPHRGDMTLFWDTNNWQSLCETCHNSVKQAQERGQLLPGCDVSGVPADGAHHWHQKPKG